MHIFPLQFIPHFMRDRNDGLADFKSGQKNFAAKIRGTILASLFQEGFILGVKRSKKPNTWEDHYARRAKKERFPARSVFKLKEIQQKHRLIKKGHKVLDLGCAPGSWLLYAAELTGPDGRVVGVDLKPVTVSLPAHVRVFTADILNPDERLLADTGTGFNVVLSDMAPATTGSRITDAARSEALCRAALEIARKRLISGGSFVCKIFQGEDFKIFIDAVDKIFVRYKIYKPASSRKASREIYVIAIEKY